MAEFVDFKTDGVWEHFLREKGGNSAKCKLCSTILKATHGSTKGLHEHLCHRRLLRQNVRSRRGRVRRDEPRDTPAVETAEHPRQGRRGRMYYGLL